MSHAPARRPHHVVIIGSGFGGLFAAKSLRKADVRVTLISDTGAEAWPRMGKDAVARQLAARIADALV